MSVSVVLTLSKDGPPGKNHSSQSQTLFKTDARRARARSGACRERSACRRQVCNSAGKGKRVPNSWPTYMVMLIFLLRLLILLISTYECTAAAVPHVASLQQDILDVPERPPAELSLVLRISPI